MGNLPRQAIGQLSVQICQLESNIKHSREKGHMSLTPRTPCRFYILGKFPTNFCTICKKINGKFSWTSKFWELLSRRACWNFSCFFQAPQMVALQGYKWVAMGRGLWVWALSAQNELVLSLSHLQSFAYTSKKAYNNYYDDEDKNGWMTILQWIDSWPCKKIREKHPVLVWACGTWD